MLRRATQAAGGRRRAGGARRGVLLGVCCLGLTVAAALAEGGADEFSSGNAEPPAAGTPSVADPAQFSEAERLLWLDEHFRAVDAPLTLTYSFTRSGSYDVGFEDRVRLNLGSRNPDGSYTANLEFFTGERQQYVPPLESVTGNPVLGIYLQGDVYEMNRLTEGHWRYFHRRLKTAMAEGAELEPIEVEFDGKRVAATRIRLQPYALDARRDRYERFADKYYELTVSPEIPGTLYEVHTVVPGEINPDGTRATEPLIEERLVLSAVERSAADSAAR